MPTIPAVDVPDIQFDRKARILYFDGCGFSEEFLRVFGRGYSECVPANSFVQVVVAPLPGRDNVKVMLHLPTASQLLLAAWRCWLDSVRFVKKKGEKNDGQSI